MRVLRIRFTLRLLMAAVGVVAVALYLWIWVARARYWLDEADSWALAEKDELQSAAKCDTHAAWARRLVARGEKRAGLAPSDLAVRTSEAVASAFRLRAAQFADLRRICQRRSLRMTPADCPLPGEYVSVEIAYRQAVERWELDNARRNASGEK
jgi:hypothetical protein